MSFDPGLMPHRPRRTPYAPLQALQFSAAQSQYLTRTPAVAGNPKKWTASWWVKRTKLNNGSGNFAMLAGGSSGSDRSVVAFGTAGSEQLRYYDALSPSDVYSVAQFRDVTSFAHIVIQFDSAQAAASDRLKFFWNDVQITSFASTGYPNVHGVGSINNNVVQYFGRWADSNTDHPDGVFADICLVDDAIEAPTAFGQTNALNQWVPKRPSVTAWGTSGFYLDGEMSGTTVLDKSGNGNDWTAVNGVTECLDVPGDKASANLGNYARWSAISVIAAAYTRATLSSAGLKAAAGAAAWHGAAGTITVRGAKFYIRYRCDAVAGANDYVRAGVSVPGVDFYYWHNGGGAYPAGPTVASYTAANVIGFAIDADTGAVWGEKNGSWQNGATLAEVEAGDTTHALWVLGAGKAILPSLGVHTSPSAFTLLAEPDDWGVTAPAGFKPLCTAHLPTKMPKNPRAQMGMALYTADDVNGRQVLIDGMTATPDFAIFKSRNIASVWRWFDSLRTPGSGNKELSSNSAGAEGSESSCGVTFIPGGVEFDVTVGGNNQPNEASSSGNMMMLAIGGLTHMTAPEVAALVTATGATITPSAIAYDATLGMAIIKWVGNQAPGASIPNPLGHTPGMIVTKCTTVAKHWAVYHSAVGPTGALFLNRTEAASTSAGYWNNTTPSATKITLGSSDDTNPPGGTCVTYLFANTDAIKVGSYVGNGSADGPFIDLGGAPQWVMMKSSTYNGVSWGIYDIARSPWNPQTRMIFANLPDSEYDQEPYAVDAVAGGLKIRCDGSNNHINAAGHTYIYLAFIDRYFGGANVAQGRAR